MNTLLKTPPRLFSIQQVSLATFLGGPLGGAILMAINRRIDDRDSACSILMLGILGFFVLLLFLHILPANLPSAPFYFSQIFAIRKWYDQDQSTLYARALENGGS